jgi:hypothetical protein
MTQTKWEYKIIDGTFNTRVSPETVSISDIEKNLNDLGKEGWEAYATTSTDTGYSNEIYLKRKISA